MKNNYVKISEAEFANPINSVIITPEFKNEKGLWIFTQKSLMESARFDESSDIPIFSKQPAMQTKGIGSVLAGLIPVISISLKILKENKELIQSIIKMLLEHFKNKKNAEFEVEIEVNGKKIHYKYSGPVNDIDKIKDIIKELMEEEVK